MGKIQPARITYPAKPNLNNYYNHSFRRTLDYNHCMCSGYLLNTATASSHIIHHYENKRTVEYLKLSFETNFCAQDRFT